MGWSIGFDERWKRDIGYGVPAICDHPGCGAEIDRGLAYVCGGEPFGGDEGCGLFFCSSHRVYINEQPQCVRCATGDKPFTPTPDTEEWNQHKLIDSSWKEWRDENPDAVVALTPHSTAPDASPQLQACPFCGEQCATLVVNQGDKWGHYEPSCLEVRTGYDVSDEAPWHAEAAAAWNRCASPPAVDPAGLTVEAMAERLRGFNHIAGMDASARKDRVAYVLTGLLPGPERDTALAAILSRLAQRSGPAEGSEGWRPMSEEPIGRPITARKKLPDGSWWYARVRVWRYEDGEGGRFGDHGYTLLHYNDDVAIPRFYGPFDSWCEIDAPLMPLATA